MLHKIYEYYRKGKERRRQEIGTNASFKTHFFIIFQFDIAVDGNANDNDDDDADGDADLQIALERRRRGGGDEKKNAIKNSPVGGRNLLSDSSYQHQNIEKNEEEREEK